MSREIKFRAWDGENKKMFYDEVALICSGVIGEFNWGLQLVTFVPKNKYVIMQFIGQKDKNGVEGYHNDIVRDEYHGVGVIEWNEVQCGWTLHFALKNGHIYTNLGLGEREIIGNVLENPELLND